MFETLEHTADIGFRVRAPTLAELLETAALALESIAVETAAIEPRHEYPLAASGEDCESLLVNWLSEVLYWIDGEQLLFHHFRVSQITAAGVSGWGVGERRDPARHRAKLIVKAVTYHQLRLAQTPDGFEAEVYLDI